MKVNRRLAMQSIAAVACGVVTTIPGQKLRVYEVGSWMFAAAYSPEHAKQLAQVEFDILNSEGAFDEQDAEAIDGERMLFDVPEEYTDSEAKESYWFDEGIGRQVNLYDMLIVGGVPTVATIFDL